MRELEIRRTINDSYEGEDTMNESMNYEEPYGDVLVEGKINAFKLRIIKQYNYLEEHYLINIILKVVFGIIILVIPFIFIILLNFINFTNKNKYYFFPYFISLCVLIGGLIILLVIKIGEGCEMYGIILYTWERKNIFKIINTIIIGFYLLWFFFICEKFKKVYNLLKEKVAQSSTKDKSTKLFNTGSYTIRILFILFFWDTEKLDGNYVHLYLDYFEYEESVLSEFHSYISSLILPIIFICLHHIIKLIIFHEKNQIFYFLFYTMIIFQCFITIFYPIDSNEDSNALTEEYFSNVGCKYVELIIYLIIIILLIISSFKEHIIKLIRKKYFPKTEKNENNKKIINFSFFIVISSFLINLIGYIIFIVLLFFFTFNKIDQEMKIDQYYNYWNIIYVSVSLILIGYSFIFGHFCYNLIYYPIAYEITPHNLKNNFYTKCSGHLIESEDNSIYQFGVRSFDDNIP